MRLSMDWPSRLQRLVFSCLMVMVWTGLADSRRASAAPPATGRAPITAEQRQVMATQFERGVRAMVDADRNGPRDTFDLAWVVQRLGPDPVRIFHWVRDRTLWVPYTL